MKKRYYTEDEIKIIPITNKIKDLTGQKFERLNVLGYAGNYYWWCKCDCGNITKVRSYSLLMGTTKSCGCYQKEKSSQLNKNNHRSQDDYFINHIYGNFKVIKFDHKGKHNERYFEVECINCKAHKIALRQPIIKYQVACPNCSKKRSTGEMTIEKILKENNIPYEKEKTFNTCRFLNTNCLARFDFYVNNEYLIEFDGEQHFLGWGNNEESLKRIQERDEFKNQWCKNNNIPLIRIPYFHLKNLTLKDLKLKTSNFII